jgi:3-oxoacyl-[acyl-carrier protein] reductase
MSKTIVISGATGALGNLVAKTFAARGDKLALLSHNQTKLDSLARELKLPETHLLTLAADLSNGDAVRSAADAVTKKFGSVHGLIHLVGGWTGGKTIPETPKEDLEFMLNNHVHTTFNLFQAFSKPLAAGDGWSLSPRPRCKTRQGNPVHTQLPRLHRRILF